ncbi:MAG: phosphate ABC transporter substrate-binding protein [Treponema sp.]|jgi:phosphate transport system substrate-binding protein|nr:phosphate ABC transporter substrate-binding protein [Treponema sp.]
MTEKLLKATAVIILIGITVSCTGRSALRVVVAGSTSVQPYVELLAEEFDHLHPGSDIDIQGGGSSAGITAAGSGIADIGMSSRALKTDEQNLFVIEIAKDGLAVIVNPGNSITNLTIEQVRGIYSAEIKDWSELGGARARIHIIAREEGSGTRTAFEELVMGERRITPRAIVQDSNGAVRQLVAGDPNSIGFISLGLVDQTVKAVDLEGVTASRENVINGSYTLFRPFLLIAKTQPTGLAMNFIDFILSPEGKKLMIDEGLIP